MSASLRTVTVDLGERSYPVVVGAGARHELGAVLPPRARRAAIVTQAGIAERWTVDPGIEHSTFLMGDGEEHKTLTTVEDLCRGFAQWGLTRADVVVAVGGGIVTDVAGFAAAAYLRGVAVVHVPTTLLGQVDAAIGGKTGVNIAEGKNLVGAFWQPSAVLCDTETLTTLPVRERSCGYGEMAKYAFLGVPDLQSLDIDEAVAACVRCKADVVGADERESLEGGGGRRMLLNYGHTLAHAIETAGHHELRHGEAVAVGLCFAARLARRMGRIDDARVAEHDALVASYDLPGAMPPGYAPEALMELMARDKKAVDGLTFVLDGPSGVEVVKGIEASVVAAALDEFCGGDR